MSRTPLMRALRDIAAHRAAADRLGMPVAEVRGATRRELLRRAAAVGAAVGAGTALAATPARAHAATGPGPAAPDRSGPRVAVVGAGIAGLTAALTLADAGLRCTLYEANPDRVGGRMWTQRGHWTHGRTSEIGGELIDTGHETVLALCRRFGLAVEDFAGGGPEGAREVLWFGGGYYPRDRADEDFAAVRRALRRDLRAAGDVTWDRHTPGAVALDTMSLYEWIETRVPGGHGSPFGRFLDVAYNVEYGADTTEQSALALVLLMGYQPEGRGFSVWGESDERFHIAGGNDRLPRAVAGALPPGTLRSGWELTAVRAEAGGGQTLTFTEDGATRTVTADHTVLCLPVPVLQRLDLGRAGLDPRMRRLLRDARMGHCTKLNLECSTRPWRGTGPWPGVTAGDAFTDTDVQQTWDTTKLRPGRGGVLIQYNGGSLAARLRPAEPFATESDPYVRELAARRLRGIDAFFPGTSRAWNGRAQLSAWHRDPYALGAYSYWPVGYVHRYAGYEGTPQGPRGTLHFAGEHTSADFQGFMEGGAAEGARAAREVLTATRRS
ncbi:flavin monoamine oxidase family protein [Streptomyces sp. NPDC015131]|uniref:flavin monoamine oxidase family protein n=1 Tax=Streptomyces sp. NPDC015131 TaxID=3364941 RepID=UPI0036FF9ED9